MSNNLHKESRKQKYLLRDVVSGFNNKSYDDSEYDYYDKCEGRGYRTLAQAIAEGEFSRAHYNAQLLAKQEAIKAKELANKVAKKPKYNARIESVYEVVDSPKPTDIVRKRRAYINSK